MLSGLGFLCEVEGIDGKLEEVVDDGSAFGRGFRGGRDDIVSNAG